MDPGGVLGWRSPCLNHVITQCSDCPATGYASCAAKDIYEFGVYTGSSMRGMSQRFKARGAGFRRMWGFDSFQGLPKELAVHSQYPKLTATSWYEGAFNAADMLKAHTFDKLTLQLDTYINDSRVRWVPGYYNESLTPALAVQSRMRPALFVDIDCDLYSSSYQVLDWMFANELIVPGTVVGYDDWASGRDFGEKRSHHEMVQKYNATFQRVKGSNPAQPCFELISVGSRKRDARRRGCF